MGPYDGLCVRTLNQKFKDLSNNKLVSNNKLMTYQGVQGPIQNMISDDSALLGPMLMDGFLQNYLCLLIMKPSNLTSTYQPIEVAFVLPKQDKFIREEDLIIQQCCELSIMIFDIHGMY